MGRWSFFLHQKFLKKEIIQCAKKAKIFQLWSSGYEKFNTKNSHSFGIPVCNNGSENAIAVAEHAVLLILALNRKLIHFHKRTVLGNWKNNSHGFDLFELRNKKIGIFGLGKIGKEVAKILNGFGCQVFYFDTKKLNKNDEKKLLVTYKKKNDLLKIADIVSLHLHLNKKTKNYINQRNIKLLKKDSLIINVSRAKLIDRICLIKALKNNKIRGLGIDAHYNEPTTKNDNLLNLENVLSTPHTAGSTIDTYKRVVKKCLDNIENAMNGKAIEFIIN